MIRILSKKEVNDALPIQQVMERTQGVILTRRVEGLRQTTLKDEINLKKYHEASVQFVKQDINELLDIKSDLEKTISLLEEKQKKLEEPTTEDWRKIFNERADLAFISGEIDIKIKDIVNRETKIVESKKDIDVEDERLKDERKELELYAKETIRNKVASDKLLKDSEMKAEKVNNLLEKELKELSIRESKLSAKESDLRLKEDGLNKKELDQNNREKKLLDRYETLKRTITRNKNGNNDSNDR